MTPQLDILLPVRNAEATLPDALRSIAKQTFTAYRVIAVDDASSDASGAILRDAAQQDPRIMIIPGEGRGLVRALNLGLTQCTAPLVARMDADDRMITDRLEKQVRWLARNPDTDVLGCQVQTDGFAPGFTAYLHWSNGLLAHDAIANSRFIEAPLVHPTVCIRRTAFDRCGAYREGDFPEDYELWLRWLEQGARFAKLGEPLMEWIDRPERLTRTDPRYRVASFYKVKLQYLATWLRGQVTDDRAIWIWGAGQRTRRRMRLLIEEGVRIAGFIDIDPRKIGSTNADGPVIGPDELPGPARSFVLAAVGSRGARELIADALQARGYREGEHFICVA